MNGWPAHVSISRAAPAGGSSIATVIDPRQRWCQLLRLSSQCSSSQRLVAMADAWDASGNRPPGASGSRMQISAPASMTSWRKARSGSLPANSPSGGKVSVRIA